MFRLGLCCTFCEAPIKFRTTTVAALKRLSYAESRVKLAELCTHNAEALMQAIVYCAEHEIGCFRVGSRILPVKTHPEVGYELVDLPNGLDTLRRFRDCARLAGERNVRLTFHPDQFVVLNSAREEVVRNSIEEIEYQAEVAEWIGADVVNIHLGGAFGDKPAAIETFRRALPRLTPRARERLTVENDDRMFTPSDLAPLCRGESIPLVYDVHHHRCNPDGLSVEEATALAQAAWNREPLFHISSPRNGWRGPNPQRHHDYIHLRDFPVLWQTLDITVEVEAKAKELAVRKLQKALRQRASRLRL